MLCTKVGCGPGICRVNSIFDDAIISLKFYYKTSYVIIQGLASFNFVIYFSGEKEYGELCGVELDNCQTGLSCVDLEQGNDVGRCLPKNIPMGE